MLFDRGQGGVFAFPALTPRFCELMREELDHFERSDMPRAHPNTMNKNGLLLYELGMHDELLTPLLERYVIASRRRQAV